jgi:hypothetical protein
MLGVNDVRCQKVTGLVIRGLNDELKIPLPKAYTRNAIPAQQSQIPDPQSAKLWTHLNVIAEDLMVPHDDVEIGLLIGANCPQAIKPREVIPGNDDDPYVVKFGTTSSPGCANAALKATADYAEVECGSRVADFVRKNFYVDDGLTSLRTSHEAINLITQSQNLCKKGGFRLHKFMSNSKEVVRSVPSNDLATGIQDLDLT